MKYSRLLPVLLLMCVFAPALSQMAGNNGINRLRDIAVKNDPDGNLKRLNYQLENAEALLNLSVQNIADEAILQDEIIVQSEKSLEFILTAQKLLNDVAIGEFKSEQMSEIFTGSELPVSQWFKDNTSLRAWVNSEIAMSISLLEQWIKGEGDEKYVLVVREKISIVFDVLTRIQFREI